MSPATNRSSRHVLTGLLVLALLVVVTAGGWWLLTGDRDASRSAAAGAASGRPAASTDATADADPTSKPTSKPTSNPTSNPTSSQSNPGTSPTSDPTSDPTGSSGTGHTSSPHAGGTSSPAPTGTWTPGSLDPVPTTEVTPEPPIALTATARFGTGVSVQITDIEAVRSQAHRPGEISRPALRLTLRVLNASDRPISLDGMVVALDHGADRTPAMSVAEPGGAPFAGALAAGSSARGVYVFNVPEADRDRIRVTTSYTGEAPTLVLAGSAA